MNKLDFLKIIVIIQRNNRRNKILNLQIKIVQ